MSQCQFFIVLLYNNNRVNFHFIHFLLYTTHYTIIHILDMLSKFTQHLINNSVLQQAASLLCLLPSHSSKPLKCSIKWSLVSSPLTVLNSPLSHWLGLHSEYLFYSRMKFKVLSLGIQVHIQFLDYKFCYRRRSELQ